MVYITGDTHGDFERLDSLRLKKGDTLIICGDFGFIWDGSAREEKILKQLGKKKFNICFIDGTHENTFRNEEQPEDNTGNQEVFKQHSFIPTRQLDSCSHRSAP